MQGLASLLKRNGYMLVTVVVIAAAVGIIAGVQHSKKSSGNVTDLQVTTAEKSNASTQIESQSATGATSGTSVTGDASAGAQLQPPVNPVPAPTSTQSASSPVQSPQSTQPAECATNCDAGSSTTTAPSSQPVSLPTCSACGGRRGISPDIACPMVMCPQ